MYLAMRKLVSAQHLCNLRLNRCSTFSRSLSSQNMRFPQCHSSVTAHLILSGEKDISAEGSPSQYQLTVKLTEHKNVALSC